MKKIWIVITVAAIVLVAGSAFGLVAKKRVRSELGGPIAMRMLAGHRGQLDLTDDQVIALRHIAQNARAQNEEARNEVRTTLRDAAQVLLANPDDVEVAQSILAKSSDARQQLAANGLVAISDALEVLTSEQRSMIAARIDQLSLADVP